MTPFAAVADTPDGWEHRDPHLPDQRIESWTRRSERSLVSVFGHFRAKRWEMYITETGSRVIRVRDFSAGRRETLDQLLARIWTAALDDEQQRLASHPPAAPS